MELVERAYDNAAENLALDELLLEDVENGERGDLLRIWEVPHTTVVLGRASRFAEETHVERCEQDGVPIIRRTTGGCAVLAGRGCLMFSLILRRGATWLGNSSTAIHRSLLERLFAALQSAQLVTSAPTFRSDVVPSGLPQSGIHGISDLVSGGRKFSGNSMRLRRASLLYHGTLLYNLSLELVPRYLAMPPREPTYRSGRPHREFVGNLRAERAELQDVILSCWPCRTTVGSGEVDAMQPAVRELVANRYGTDRWNRRM